MRSSFDEAIEMIVRNEWGRLLALLATQFRDLDFAEDALQEAVTRAVVTWPERGIPANPAAWLLTTARRIAIDDVRRARTFEQKWLLLETDARFEMNQEMITFDDDIPDERLRLIFTCCHPALSQDTRVMLTLRTLGGLTTAEIASALLKEEATVAQRIFGLITRAGPFPHTRSPAAFESPVLRNLATKTIDFARRTVFRFGDTFNFPIDGFRPTGFALKVAFTVLA